MLDRVPDEIRKLEQLASFIVAACGVVVAKQLSSVPENAMKMSVGVLLVSYGTFWVGEGLKVRWPGNDSFLVAFVGIYAVVCWALINMIRPKNPSSSAKVGA